MINELRDRWINTRKLREWGLIDFELQYRRIKLDLKSKGVSDVEGY